MTASTITTPAPTTAAPVSPVVHSPNVKYRVGIRYIAVDNGFTFAPSGADTDVFTRTDDKGTVETVSVHHNSGHRIVAAERQIGVDGPIDHLPSSRGRMFVVQEWLTGVPDEYDPKTGKGKRFIRLTPAQVEKFESGSGLAKLIAPSTEDVAKPAPAKKAAPRPTPAAKKAPSPTSPAKKAPSPAAVAKKAPARKAGTKVPVHTSVEDMGF